MPRKSKIKAALSLSPLAPATSRLPALRRLLFSRGHDVSELQRFLEGGGSPNVSSTWGMPKPFCLLHMLLMMYETNKIEHLKSFKLLLQAGAAIDSFSCSQMPGEPDKSVLMEAAYRPLLMATQSCTLQLERATLTSAGC
jgi:hypothetical protein